MKKNNDNNTVQELWQMIYHIEDIITCALPHQLEQYSGYDSCSLCKKYINIKYCIVSCGDCPFATDPATNLDGSIILGCWDLPGYADMHGAIMEQDLSSARTHGYITIQHLKDLMKRYIRKDITL